ncbi:MAG: AI-2E family transporter [Pseudomonadota bacterium]
MRASQQIRFWLIGLVVALVLIYLLREILLPFVAGMAIAYLLDPICDRLEKWKLSRTLATTLVTVLFAIFIIAVLLLLIPTLVSQIANFLKRAPAYVEVIRGHIADVLDMLEARIDPALYEKIRATLADSTDHLITWVSQAATAILSQGVALANLLSLIVITPVVAFYLLRDWDNIVALVDSWLPRKNVARLRDLARQVDETLAGFLRGQGLVCLLLGTFYAIGLTIVGLDFGLVIGMIAGLLTFIPYAGSAFGLVLSVGLAMLQFDSWLSVGLVALVFIIGQAIEGNYLTPKLVGDRVGLHPVWVIFAILAGGVLFGFVGVLLAVPIAAVIGVGVRFGLSQYLDSPYYTGGPHAGGAATESASQGEDDQG